MAKQPGPRAPQDQGGYPLAFFVNPGDVKTFQCPLCDMVCKDAVELSCEEHSANDDDLLCYCLACLKDHLEIHDGRCPAGKNHFGSFHENKFIRRTVLRATVRCPYELKADKDGDEEESGVCEWTGFLKDWSAHARKCAWKSNGCSYEGCDFRGSLKQIAVHEESNAAHHLRIVRAEAKQSKEEQEAMTEQLQKLKQQLQHYKELLITTLPLTRLELEVWDHRGHTGKYVPQNVLQSDNNAYWSLTRCDMAGDLADWIEFRVKDAGRVEGLRKIGVRTFDREEGLRKMRVEVGGESEEQKEWVWLECEPKVCTLLQSDEMQELNVQHKRIRGGVKRVRFTFTKNHGSFSGKNCEYGVKEIRLFGFTREQYDLLG